MTIVEVVHELNREFGTDAELRILPGAAGGVVLWIIKHDKGQTHSISKAIPPERVVFGGEDTFRYAVGEMIKSLKETGGFRDKDSYTAEDFKGVTEIGRIDCSLNSTKNNK